MKSKGFDAELVSDQFERQSARKSVTEMVD